MINEAIEIKIVSLRRKELYQQLKGLATEILNSLKIKYNLK
jgi:hypothetical protein